MENLNDFDWCCNQILAMVEVSDLPGAWEEFIIRNLVEKNYGTVWGNRTEWVERGQQSRVYYAQIAIQHLITTKRIHAVPGESTATGRRCFRPTNLLDSIAQSL